MKKLIFILLFCCLSGNIMGAREFKDYLVISEAEKSREEADKAYAMAKLKEARSYIGWSKFKEASLKVSFELYNYNEVNIKSYHKKITKKIMKKSNVLIKDNVEVANAYYKAADAYNKTVKLYTKADTKESEDYKGVNEATNKDTTSLDVSEEVKLVQAYCEVAKAAMSRVAFLKIQNKKVSVDDFNKAYDKAIKMQSIAFAKEVKAINIKIDTNKKQKIIL